MAAPWKHPKISHVLFIDFWAYVLKQSREKKRKKKSRCPFCIALYPSIHIGCWDQGGRDARFEQQNTKQNDAQFIIFLAWV